MANMKVNNNNWCLWLISCANKETIGEITELENFFSDEEDEFKMILHDLFDFQINFPVDPDVIEINYFKENLKSLGEVFEHETNEAKKLLVSAYGKIIKEKGIDITKFNALIKVSKYEYNGKIQESEYKDAKLLFLGNSYCNPYNESSANPYLEKLFAKIEANLTDKKTEI